MTSKYDDLLSAQNQLKEYMEANQEALVKIGRTINNICGQLHKTSSGSWAGYHASLYFRNYQQPNISEQFDSEWGGAGVFNGGYDPGWQPRDLDDIWKYIYTQSSVEFNIDEVNDKRDRITELGEALKDRLEFYVQDSRLKKKIEDNAIGFGIGDYIKAREPGRIMSRDSKAIYQGMKVPPHIHCNGFGESLLINIKSAKELLKFSELALVELRDLKTQSYTVWHLTNPIWAMIYLTKKSVSLITRHKFHAVISTFVIIVGFIAIDYGLAWNNIRSLLDWTIGLF